ncbi:MAG: T9SS type A sorting domain-containing protein [Candidatus Cloacimonetes bacterium]|nr:T9SS type A sorting domain-containing protein [Candidatus Cloacimonadota bacterium]
MKCTIWILMFLLATSIYGYEISVGPFIPKGVFCEDLNNDGYVDLLIISNYPKVYVLLNNGDGTFGDAVSLPVGKIKSIPPKLYDFNSDGWYDIDGFFEQTDEFGVKQVSLRIYINCGGVFDEDFYIELPPMPPMDWYLVFCGDWNGDGFTDVLIWIDGVYHLFLNNNGKSFTGTGETIAMEGGGGFRDIDSDGFDELLVSTSEGLQVYKYPDLINPFFILPNYPYLNTVVAEDLDLDGDLDIFATFSCSGTSSAVCIYENLGDYNYLVHNNHYNHFNDFRSFFGVLFRDITNDQYLDIVNYAYVSPMNPAGFDYPLSLFYFLPINMPNYSIYYENSGYDYVDVDNNGFLDFVLVWAQTSARLRVYYNDGMGNFSDDPIVSDNNGLNPMLHMKLSVYPNPFTEKVNIEYTPCSSGKIGLKIYNIKGQLVRSYHKDARANELQHIQWDGNDEIGRTVSKGIYFCMINIDNKQTVKKIVKIWK